MRRYRHRKRDEVQRPSVPVRQPHDVPNDEAPPALFDGDVASQRLFNRAALAQMGDYSAVILASDSLRPAWAEPGDLVHVRRGAEDARNIVDTVSGKKR
ncbi:hypothetical protein [Hyphobacterium sp.]|jgi:hypothetical protein|uniref:hypothetical protein n=1 Tax=Hyphobacterium sp. TaxID=2004662 RepID=UPI003BAC51AC